MWKDCQKLIGLDEEIFIIKIIIYWSVLSVGTYIYIYVYIQTLLTFIGYDTLPFTSSSIQNLCQLLKFLLFNPPIILHCSAGADTIWFWRWSERWYDVGAMSLSVLTQIQRRRGATILTKKVLQYYKSHGLRLSSPTPPLRRDNVQRKNTGGHIIWKLLEELVLQCGDIVNLSHFK